MITVITICHEMQHERSRQENVFIIMTRYAISHELVLADVFGFLWHSLQIAT